MFLGRVFSPVVWMPCVVAGWVVLALAASGEAQNPARPNGPPSGYRRLAPGVETVIPADVNPGETVSYHNLPAVLTLAGVNWQPQTFAESRTIRAQATNAAVRREVWNLEFAFKPMRMMAVDLPAAGGKMQRKMIWYMVYRVTNMGGHLKPVVAADGTVSLEKVNHPVEFSPQFLLYSPESKKAYLDKLLPVAIESIRRREDPRRKLLDSVEMAAKPIEVSTPENDQSVWGVATWESGMESADEIDPRTDYFSIFVSGLSNAYKFADPPGAFKAGDPPATGRLYRQKTLQLNFWRPSDAFREGETEIFFGLPPELRVRGQIDYQWVFR